MTTQARIEVLWNTYNAMTSNASLKEKAALVAKIRNLEAQL